LLALLTLPNNFLPGLHDVGLLSESRRAGSQSCAFT
jgi:hypothetical protein